MLIRPHGKVEQDCKSGEDRKEEIDGMDEQDESNNEDQDADKKEEEGMHIEDDEIPSPEIPEAREPKALPDPGNASSEEIEKHYLANHLPFRSWCECCVQGKAKDLPHKRPQVGGPSEIPVIGMDFQHPGTDDKDEAKLNILTVKDSKSKAVFCYPCNSKVPNADIEHQVVTDLETLGYNRIAPCHV